MIDKPQQPIFVIPWSGHSENAQLKYDFDWDLTWSEISDSLTNHDLLQGDYFQMLLPFWTFNHCVCQEIAEIQKIYTVVNKRLWLTHRYRNGKYKYQSAGGTFTFI